MRLTEDIAVYISFEVVADGDCEVSLNNLCQVSHRLQEYSSETGLAIVIDGNDILKVNAEHLTDLTFQVGSVYQFIGELLIQPDNEVCASVLVNVWLKPYRTLCSLANILGFVMFFINTHSPTTSACITV